MSHEPSPGGPLAIRLLPEAMDPWKDFIQGSGRVLQVLLKALPRRGEKMSWARFGKSSSVILQLECWPVAVTIK